MNDFDIFVMNFLHLYALLCSTYIVLRSLIITIISILEHKRIRYIIKTMFPFIFFSILFFLIGDNDIGMFYLGVVCFSLTFVTILYHNGLDTLLETIEKRMNNEKQKQKNKQGIQITEFDKIDLSQRWRKMILAKPGESKKMVFVSLYNHEFKLFEDFCEKNAFKFTISRVDTKTNKIEICCEEAHFFRYEAYRKNQNNKENIK